MSLDTDLENLITDLYVNNIENLDRDTFLFKNYVDHLIENYVYSHEQTGKRTRNSMLQKISDYILSGTSYRLSEEKKVFLQANIKELIEEYARQPILSGDEDLARFAMRDNGINYRVSHYINVARTIAQNDLSFEEILIALNHDAPEDFCEYENMFEDEKEYTDAQLANEKIEDISDFCADTKLRLDVSRIEDGLTRVTRFNEKDYQGDISDVTRYESENDLKSVYSAIRVKLADRIHNTQTMRPIKERQKKLIEIANRKRGLSRRDSKKRLFKFDNIIKVFYEGGDLDEFIKDQKLNQIEHDYITREFDTEGHSIDHFFNTTKHSFIIKNIYKNMILLNKVNHFLENQKDKSSWDYRKTVKLKEELIHASFSDIVYQLEHSLRNHVDLHEAGKLFREARDYDGWRELTEPNQNSNYDGILIAYLTPLMNNKEGFYPPKELKKMLNLPGDVENPERFKLYIALFHLFQEFDKGDNFYYEKLLSSKTTPAYKNNLPEIKSKG